MEQNANVLGAGLYRLDRDALAALAQELCAQLTARGAYHGGIRPDNIGCDKNGAYSLGEDGGRDMNREWTPDELEYMAPEVFWNGTRTLSADVYSLGMLLYAGVNSGQLPFYPAGATPDDRAEALRRRMSGETLPMPRTAGKHLAKVIEKATQFRSDDRYESPQAFSDALGETRLAIRSYVPPAREMFDKPDQELSEVERMLLTILTEKQEAERRALAEQRAAEEAARAKEEAARAAETEAAARAAREAEQAEQAEPEPPAPEAPVEETAAPPEPEEPRTVKKPGVDPALVEAISASVAARMADSEPKKPQPKGPQFTERHQQESERISQQLEQMDWIGQKNVGRRSHSGLIAALLSIVAIVLGVMIFKSILPKAPVPIVAGSAEESPAVTMEAIDPTQTAAPDESTEPPVTPTPTPTPTPVPQRTFEVVLSDASWEQARAEAEARGGHLAVIQSADDLAKITQLAAEKGAKYVWIGLRRMETGDLQWVQENPSPYVVWASGEPSGYDAYTGQPENYVLLANQSGAWTFNDCSNDPAGNYPGFYSGRLAYVIEFDS